MNINLPSKVRAALYVFTALGSIVITYLAAANIIGSNEVAAWTAFTALIAGLARINITPEE